ncbi:MAG: hypothetical protein QOE91_314, partial [Gaiellaceae bacterium]|nr:hypothetical protein [Gaiellaceae bacterium]
TPQELKQLAPKADIVEFEPGDTIEL